MHRRGRLGDHDADSRSWCAGAWSPRARTRDDVAGSGLRPCPRPPPHPRWRSTPPRSRGAASSIRRSAVSAAWARGGAGGERDQPHLLGAPLGWLGRNASPRSVPKTGFLAPSGDDAAARSDESVQARSAPVPAPTPRSWGAGRGRGARRHRGEMRLDLLVRGDADGRRAGRGSPPWWWPRGPSTPARPRGNRHRRPRRGARRRAGAGAASGRRRGPRHAPPGGPGTRSGSCWPVPLRDSSGSRQLKGCRAGSASSTSSQPPGARDRTMERSAASRSVTWTSTNRAWTRSKVSRADRHGRRRGVAPRRRGVAGVRRRRSTTRRCRWRAPCLREPTRRANHCGTDGPPAPTSQQRQPAAIPSGVDVAERDRVEDRCQRVESCAGRGHPVVEQVPVVTHGRMSRPGPCDTS